MTRNDHESGTDRLVEVMHKVEADIYINLQGDEPMIRPRDVETLLQGMPEISPDAEYARYRTRKCQSCVFSQFLCHQRAHFFQACGDA